MGAYLFFCLIRAVVQAAIHGAILLASPLETLLQGIPTGRVTVGMTSVTVSTEHTPLVGTLRD